MKADIMIILAITICLKSIAYYCFMGRKTDRQILNIITVLCILFLFNAALLIGNTVVTVVVGFMYMAVSAVMLVDAAYYKQFNMFTSINLIGMIGKLSEVKSSVKQIVDFKLVLFMLDVPIVVYCGIMSFSFSPPSVSEVVLGFSIIILFAFFASLPSLGISIMGKQSVFYKIARTEFFHYHLYDIYVNKLKKDDTFFSKEELMKDISGDEDGEDEFFGICKSENLIVIQLESFQEFLIGRFYDDQEITPFLNSLISKNSIYFKNYYHQVGYGNTSDAEFVSNNSLYGSLKGSTYDIYENTKFYGIPRQLAYAGYSTRSFHGFKGDYWNRRKAHAGQGFEEFIAREELGDGENIGMGMSDEEFYKKVVLHIEKMKTPFYAFLISLTMHHPYKITSQKVEIKLKKEDENSLTGNYIQMARYIDTTLKGLFDALKEKKLYDNTLFAVYGDHQGISVNDKNEKKSMSRILGYEYNVHEMARIPLIIHSKSIDDSKSVRTVGGQIDFMPTILNLLGVKNKNPFILGQNLMSAKTGFVPMIMYTGLGSYIDDEVVLLVDADGIFENAHAFKTDTREPVDIEECRAGYERALKEVKKSTFIKDNDLIATLF